MTQKAYSPTILETLARGTAPLLMSRSYRGLLMTEPVQLLSHCAEEAHIQGPRVRVCARPGDQVFLHGESQEDAVSGKVLKIDILRCQMILGELSLTGQPWVERGHDRVCARQAVRVVLHCGGATLPGFLENLSIAGAGLLIYKPREHGMLLEVGQPGRIDFELPYGRIRLSMSGRVANLGFPSPHVACLGLHTFPTLDQTRHIDRFITRRKDEIIQEFERTTAEVFEPHSVMRQYF